MTREELLAKAKEKDIEMSETQAEALLEKLAQASEALPDEELAAVSGGARGFVFYCGKCSEYRESVSCPVCGSRCYRF